MENLAGTTSDFNMGLAILERINMFLNVVAEAKISGDFKLWRDSLMTISDEMADTYSKEQEEEFIKLLEEINPLILKAQPRYVFGSHSPKIDISGEEYNILYLKLRELDKFVRLMLNQRNMLLKKSRDVTKASARMG